MAKPPSRLFVPWGVVHDHWPSGECLPALPCIAGSLTGGFLAVSWPRSSCIQTDSQVPPVLLLCGDASSCISHREGALGFRGVCKGGSGMVEFDWTARGGLQSKMQRALRSSLDNVRMQ